MAVYSIRDIEKLTGIKAHTLRAWEQRYDLVTPRRTETNIRYYLDEDLRELLNIALLNKNGKKISKIAAMSRSERVEAVAEISSINVSPDAQLDALTLSTVEMDEFKFSHILDTNIKQRGFEETMLEVVYPFLSKLQVLYFTGSMKAVQESFIATLIRQKIIAATDQLKLPRRRREPVFVLYLPKGESQELSMLFIQYLLRRRGYTTLYLGTDIGPTDLGDVAATLRIDYIYTILSNNFVEAPVARHVKEVLEACPAASLLLSGPQASLHQIENNARTRIIEGLDAMLAFAESLKEVELVQ